MYISSSAVHRVFDRSDRRGCGQWSVRLDNHRERIVPDGASIVRGALQIAADNFLFFASLPTFTDTVIFLATESAIDAMWCDSSWLQIRQLIRSHPTDQSFGVKTGALVTNFSKSI